MVEVLSGRRVDVDGVEVEREVGVEGAVEWWR